MGAGAAKTLAMLLSLSSSVDPSAAVDAGYACVKQNANDAACWLKLGDALVVRSGAEDSSRARVAYGVFLDMAGPKNTEVVRVKAALEMLTAPESLEKNDKSQRRLDDLNEALIVRAFHVSKNDPDYGIRIMIGCTNVEKPYPGCLWALSELYRAKNDLVKAERAARLFLQSASLDDPHYRELRLRYP